MQKERLVEIRKATIQALEEGQADFLEIQSNKRPPHVFKEGQKVLLKKQKASKWTPSYYGPFIVTKIISESIIKVEDPISEKRDTIHSQYVKPYYDLTSFHCDIQKHVKQFPADMDDSEKEIVLTPSYHTYDPEKEIILECEEVYTPKPRDYTPSAPPTDSYIPSAPPADDEGPRESTGDTPLSKRLRSWTQKARDLPRVLKGLTTPKVPKVLPSTPTKVLNQPTMPPPICRPQN